MKPAANPETRLEGPENRLEQAETRSRTRPTLLKRRILKVTADSERVAGAKPTHAFQKGVRSSIREEKWMNHLGSAAATRARGKKETSEKGMQGKLANYTRSLKAPN